MIRKRNFMAVASLVSGGLAVVWGFTHVFSPFGAAIAILATLIFVNVGIVQLRIQALRRRGIYPAKGRATTADVERLLKAGHRIWAIRCYREIHDVELATAKAAVETLRVSG